MTASPPLELLELLALLELLELLELLDVVVFPSSLQPTSNAAERTVVEVKKLYLRTEKWIMAPISTLVDPRVATKIEP